MSPQLYIL
ncbi:hypothetical protein [Plasmodium yoelii yoelii]|uniref:Uncharacterized protein n=1 Tax=Plasmodium yoelii yoelii TaxID=73239 RepID=Q7RHY3_PLAYO|nr:hypothetical protein [Plasmodium yoelii yoelii]